MTSGLRALRKIQIGEESTKGDAVAATAGLAGVLTMKDSPTIHRPVEERGTLAEFSRSVKVANFAELTLESDATFEQILYLLHMGVLGAVSPGGAGDAKTWIFTPAMAAAGVFDSFTFEFGDDIEQWEVEHCLAKAIEISGAMNEPMRIRGDIFGRKMTVCNFTTGQSIPSVLESIIFQKARLYIDAETGKIGATEKSSTLISLAYSIATGLKEKRYADGSLDFSGYAETFKGVDLRMTFAFNAGAEVERLLFDGETLRLIRIEVLGGSAQADEDSTDDVGDDPLAIGATSILVTASSNFTADEVIEIGTEKMLVTVLANATHLTVVRGYHGTTDAEHALASDIYHVHDKRLRLDFTGIYTDWAPLSEREGEDVVEVTMSSQRGANYTKLFEVAVVNKVATLP